jgi:hypothetical protein
MDFFLFLIGSLLVLILLSLSVFHGLASLRKYHRDVSSAAAEMPDSHHPCHLMEGLLGRGLRLDGSSATRSLSLFRVNPIET